MSQKKGFQHLDATDIEQVNAMLLCLGIATETGEIDNQTVIDMTMAISTFMYDRAKANAKNEAEIEAQAVQQ